MSAELPNSDAGNTIDLAVVGLGYVGLPLVQGATRVGMRVVGLDASRRVVDGLNAGRSHVDDISDSDVAEILELGFRASTDHEILSAAAAVIICVPTPLSSDGKPDLSMVIDAGGAVAKHMYPGVLVVLESTSYPGTTEEVLRPILEAGGAVAGIDFKLAFSPERIDPGNKQFGLSNTPKVVGGVTSTCTEAAANLYGRFVDEVVTVATTREAEMAKLLENTYRHINIALVNEMAKFCHEMNIDLWDVIRAAGSKPFGFQAFYPGPGVGGHCIPIDPNYLSYKVNATLHRPFRFVDLAQEVNASMPQYVVSRCQELLNKDRIALNGAKVLLLGVTYKPNIADLRESPSDDVAMELLAKGSEVWFHDPYVEEWRGAGVSMSRVADLEASLRECDLAVLLQDHTAYDLSLLESAPCRVLDTRGKLRGDRVERL
jgi:nucleotide sugar dehydrogenase